jgi:hypothetical protein
LRAAIEPGLICLLEVTTNLDAATEVPQIASTSARPATTGGFSHGSRVEQTPG